MSTIIFKEFLMSLSVALIFFVIFALISRGRVRRTGYIWPFLFVLMATWAGGVWIRPFGPELAHIRWLQFLVVGLLAILLAALFAPLKPPRGRDDTLKQLDEIPRQKQLEKMAYIALSVVFWLVLCILTWAVIANYVVR